MRLGVMAWGVALTVLLSSTPAVAASEPANWRTGAYAYSDAVVRSQSLRIEQARERARRAAVRSAAFSDADERQYRAARERAGEAAEDERAAREELDELNKSSISVRSKARPVIERAEVVRDRYVKAAAAFVRDVPSVTDAQRAELDEIATQPRRGWRSAVEHLLGADHLGLEAAVGYLEARAAWDDARAARDAAVDRTTGRAEAIAKATKALERAERRREGAEAALHALVVRLAPHRRIDNRGCPLVALPGTVPAGVDLGALCARAVAAAPTPQAARAIAWALAHLGAPYACDGSTRMQPLRFDCSSLVSRAYAEGARAGLLVDGWAPTTHTMQPWGGATRHPAFRPIRAAALQPGDLALYETCQGPDCLTQHVVMYLGVHEGRRLMVHTNRCGGVSNVTAFWGTGAERAFMGARRVQAPDPD